MQGNTQPQDLTTQHVRGAVQGNESSLNWLVARFSPLLYAVARRRLGGLHPRYDPSDVVQDVWASTLPKLSALELRGPRSTPTVLKYLTTAVVNRVHSMLERHLTRQLAGERSTHGLGHLADSASGIVTKAMRSESIGRVHQALKRLSETDREIILLRGLEQQSLPAVADQLGLNLGAAATRFHRALKRLEQLLPDFMLGELADDT